MAAVASPKQQTAREYVRASIDDAYRALNDIKDLLPSTGLIVSDGITDELEAARSALASIEDHLKEATAQDGGEKQ